MRDFLIRSVHLIVPVALLIRPGGTRSVIAESVLARHELLILDRGRKPERPTCALQIESLPDYAQFTSAPSGRFDQLLF